MRESALLHPGFSRAAAVQAVVELYFDRDRIVDDYWTFDVVHSTACRQEWRPPNAASLDVAVLPCTAERFAHEIGGWMDMFVSDGSGAADANPRLKELAAAVGNQLLPQGARFIARWSGLSVGCLAAHVLEPRMGKVQAVYVVPDHRRAGTGRLLLAAAKAWARRRGCHTLRLGLQRSMEPARRLAERCGFVDNPAYPGADPANDVWCEWKAG